MNRPFLPVNRSCPPDDQVDFQWHNRNRLSVQWELQGLVKPRLPGIDYTTHLPERSLGHGHVVIVEASGWRGDRWRFGVFLEKTPKKYRVFLFANGDYTERIISVRPHEFFIRDDRYFVRYHNLRASEEAHRALVEEFLYSDRPDKIWPKYVHPISREELIVPDLIPPIPRTNTVPDVPTSQSPAEWLLGYPSAPLPTGPQYLQAAILPRILDEDGDETGLCSNCLSRQALCLRQCKLCSFPIHIG